MNSEIALLSLRDAGVKLIDCVHKTPAGVDQGFPYIAIPQLMEGRIDVDGARRISEQDMLEWNVKCDPQEDDIVLSRRCNPGVTAVIPKEFRGSLGQNLVLLRATDPSLMEPNYLRWVTRGREWWNEVGRYINVGAVFESLRCADIPEFAIPVPPVAEQKAIAHILGTLDDKIELNRKTNETLEAMAKALFKSWFVDFDPVRAKAEGRPTGLPAEISDLFPDSFEDSELGEIPSGWCVSTIGEKIKWNHGKTWEAHLRVEDSTITALGSNGIMGKSALEMGYDRIVVMGNRGSCGALNDFNGAYWVTNNAYYIAEKENAYFEYWRQVLRSIDFTPFIGGSSNPFMPLKNFAHICVACPPDSMLRRFSQSGVTIRERIERIDQESTFLSQIRNTLLPKLISGEIRIPDAEKMLEEVGV